MTAAEKDSWRDRAVSLSYLIASLTSFALAMYSIWQDRAASAGVAAGFCIGFIILRQLPVIESIELFNLKAKFVDRVNESDRILGQVRQTAKISASMLLSQLAWIDRMGSMGWARKRHYIAELDRTLLEIGVDASFLENAKIPVLNIVSLDLFRIFSGSWQHVVREKQNELRQQLSNYTGGRAIHPDDPELLRLTREIEYLSVTEPALGDLNERGPLTDVRSLTKAMLGQVRFDDPTRKALLQIAEEVSQLSDACWVSGNVTNEAEDYLEAWSRPSQKRLDAILCRSDD